MSAACASGAHDAARTMLGRGACAALRPARRVRCLTVRALRPLISTWPYPNPAPAEPRGRAVLAHPLPAHLSLRLLLLPQRPLQARRRQALRLRLAGPPVQARAALLRPLQVRPPRLSWPAWGCRRIRAGLQRAVQTGCSRRRRHTFEEAVPANAATLLMATSHVQGMYAGRHNAGAPLDKRSRVARPCGIWPVPQPHALPCT